MSDQMSHAASEARQARDAVNDAADHGQKALDEALGAGQRTIAMATRAAERVLKDLIENLDVLRGQTSAYLENSGQHIDEGKRYLADHVRQRPMAATLAGLGLGLFLGVLLSHRSGAAD